MKNAIYQYTIFGQISDPNAYGGGVYSSDAYGESTQTGTTDPSTQQPVGMENEPLANTGFDIILPIALGATMVVGSIVALIKMHKGKKAQQ